jgi:hypothetical protein
VVGWANGIPVTQFFISAISLLEIERGTLRIVPGMPRKESPGGWIEKQILSRSIRSRSAMR